MSAHNRNQVLIVLISLVIFLPFLGVVNLFDWDEINFAEAAREMIVTGNYSSVQINFQPFWEKPPLFIWMQALSMKVFGVNEFAARFPNAICGVITLLVLYRTGAKMFNEKLGLWWALLYAGSFLPHFYFKSGIIDPWFNLFIFLGIVHAVYVVQDLDSKRLKNVVLSGLFIGLAIMTKGPVALLIFLLTYAVYLLIKRFKNALISPKQIFLFLASTIAVGGIWFVIEYFNGRGYIVKDFIVYQIRLLQTQDAGHGGPFFYHFIVLLVGCFPASVFAFKTIFKRYPSLDKQGLFILWMKILFWVVLILFSLVRTKIVHYSSMCYFPLTFLGALGIYELIKENKNSRSIKISTAVVGTIFSLIVIALPFLDKYKDLIIEKGLINDEFAVEAFKTNVGWQGWEFGIGVFMLIAVAIFAWKFTRNKRLAIVSLLVGNVILLNLVATIYLPKIEGYSQNAAIEFYKSKQGVDCHILTVGFKSYADYFYAKKQPPRQQNVEEQWLVSGNHNQEVFIVSKVTKREKLKLHYPQFELIGEKNGYTFYKRTKP